MAPRPPPTHVAEKLWRDRFSGALAIFCAGSVVRGEQTPHSDLDIVVLLDSVPNAWRESMVVDAWPVELFVHDLETLAHFVQEDCEHRRPSLPDMIANAVVVPRPSSLSDRVQAWARAILQRPPHSSQAALDDNRYFISDLLDDLRDQRPRPELVAIASRLYEQLGSFLLSSHDRWSGAGKHLPRRLLDLDPSLAQAFHRAFDALFIDSDPQPLISFTERVLEPFGGPLFDGYRRDAPATARGARPNLDI
jgi:hypothetical protein